MIDWSVLTQPAFSYPVTIGLMILMYIGGNLAGAQRERVRLRQPNDADDTLKILEDIYKQQKKKK